MKKIATLGPKGTFSDTASQKYIRSQTANFELEYYDSIKIALNSIGHECDLGILPVENFSEGFISLVLDHLLDADLTIEAEIRLPIQFSLVSQAAKIADIKELYAQFVAKGQCSEFINSLSNTELHLTESNIESLNLAIHGAKHVAAVVPSGSYQAKQFPLVIEDINDYNNNETRFLVLSSHAKEQAYAANLAHKTSVIIMDENDHPGFLGEVLMCFSQRKINLTSIMSRPTRQTFGKYHFFIDFDGHVLDPSIAAALDEIALSCKVKVLGSYPKTTAQ